MKFIGILLLISLGVQAEWSKASLEDFNSLATRRGHQNVHPDVLTLWGGVKRFFKGNDLKGEAFKVSLEPFQNKLELYAYGNHSKSRAPLVIFFPGIFGGHKGKISPWMLNIFESSSFHTGVVPNFLNKNYIKAAPQYNKKNALELDTRAALMAVEKIIEKVGLDRVESVTFLGESLGGYVAASSIQFQREFPQVFKLLKNLVLLWPSLNLKDSLKAFDQKMAQYAPAYQECSYVLEAFSFFKHFIWQDYPHGVSKESARCFGAYLFHGSFLKSMTKSYEAYIKTASAKSVRAPKNFHQFLEVYNPHYLQAMAGSPEKMELEHWLKKWKKSSVGVKIVSSVDDFINDQRKWKTIENKRLLEWGAHCAPVSLNEWGRILKREAR